MPVTNLTIEHQYALTALSELHAKHSLRLSTFAVLVCFEASNSRKDISELLGSNQRAMSASFTSLINRGYLERMEPVKDPGKKAVTPLKLAQKSIELLAEFRKAMTALIKPDQSIDKPSITETYNVIKNTGGRGGISIPALVAIIQVQLDIGELAEMTAMRGGGDQRVGQYLQVSRCIESRLLERGTNGITRRVVLQLTPGGMRICQILRHL